MSNIFVRCKVCQGEVDSFSQVVKYIFTPEAAIQEREVIIMACGCEIDFPDWQIDVNTGLCKIYNFAGTLFLEFTDEEMILEEEDE